MLRSVVVKILAALSFSALALTLIAIYAALWALAVFIIVNLAYQFCATVMRITKQRRRLS